MPNDSSDPRAYRVEVDLNRVNSAGRDGKAASDWQTSRVGQVLDQAGQWRIVGGVVQDTTAYVHQYKVAVDGQAGTMMATLLAHSSMGLVGARSTNTIAIGNAVLLFWKPGSPSCFIAGVVPEPNLDPVDAISDYVVAGGNSGLTTDATSKGVFNVNGVDENGVSRGTGLDYSGGRPFDSITVGEQGAMAETGVGYHADPFLAFLRVNEETGVFGFYQDSLLRVTGHNLQLSSVLFNREDFDDRGEVVSEEGYAHYIWEALGFPDNNTTRLRNYSAQSVQQDLPYYFYSEPAFDDQQSIYRLLKFRGYLGQGEKQILQAPPFDALDGAGLQYSDNDPFFGLIDEQSFLTGRYLLRSAKSVTFAKQPQIVSPKRVAPPNDPTGDNAQNYKAASAFGDGPTHVVSPEVQLNSQTVSTVQNSVFRAAMFFDQLTYSGNYEGVQPFWNHTGSWYTPEASVAAAYYLQEPQVPDYTQLAYNQYSPAPAAVPFGVDGRYNSGNYYPNSSYFSLLDDGGIVMSDGWGSEIKMTAGSIEITCPGDLVVKTGRSFIVQSGFDSIVRANNSVDITANAKDVRLKANNNLMLLGGNEVCGGILLESRAPGPAYDCSNPGESAVITGIVLRAPSAQIVSVAQDIVAMSQTWTYSTWCIPDGPGVTGSGSPPSGQFCIDTGPQGNIITYSQVFNRFLGGMGGSEGAAASPTQGSATDIIGATDGTYTYNDYSPGITILDGQLQTSDAIFAVGEIASLSDVVAVDGYFYSTQAAVNENYVLQLDSGDEANYEDEAESVQQYLNATLPAYFASVVDEGRYDFLDRATGNVCTVQFSLRTPTDYGTEFSYQSFETRWQRMARTSGQTLPVWTENGVTDVSGTNMPYPGYDPWVTTANGVVTDLTFAGEIVTANDRGTPLSPNNDYINPAYQTPIVYYLQGNYTVTGIITG